MNQNDNYAEELLRERIEGHSFEFKEEYWTEMSAMMEGPKAVAHPWNWLRICLNSLAVVITGAGMGLIGWSAMDSGSEAPLAQAAYTQVQPVFASMTVADATPASASPAEVIALATSPNSAALAAPNEAIASAAQPASVAPASLPEVITASAPQPVTQQAIEPEHESPAIEEVAAETPTSIAPVLANLRAQDQNLVRPQVTQAPALTQTAQLPSDRVANQPKSSVKNSSKASLASLIPTNRNHVIASVPEDRPDNKEVELSGPTAQVVPSPAPEDIDNTIDVVNSPSANEQALSKDETIQMLLAQITRPVATGGSDPRPASESVVSSTITDEEESSNELLTTIPGEFDREEDELLIAELVIAPDQYEPGMVTSALKKGVDETSSVSRSERARRERQLNSRPKATLRGIRNGGRGLFKVYALLPDLGGPKGPAGRQIWGIKTHDFGNSVIFNFWDNPAFVGLEKGQNFRLRADRSFLGLYQPSGGLVSDIKDRDIYRAPTNHQAAFDLRVGEKRRTGFGVFVNTSNNRLLSETEYGMALSRRFVIRKKHVLSFGANLSLFHHQLFQDDLTYSDMIDARRGFIYSTREPERSSHVAGMDVSAGVFYANQHFFLGSSVRHITEPNKSFSMDHQEGNDIPREYTAQAGFNLALGAKSKFELTPSAITTIRQNTVNYSPAVFLKHRNSYMVGASFRNLNMLTAHGGVLVGHHFRFTVAAGVPTTSDMRAFGNIGYVQTGFRYQFGNRDRKTTPFDYE